MPSTKSWLVSYSCQQQKAMLAGGSVYPCCDCDDGQAYGRGQQHQTAQLLADGDAHFGHVTGRRRQQTLSQAGLRAMSVVCVPFLAVHAGWCGCWEDGEGWRRGVE